MRLDRYLDRLGYEVAVRPDVSTLKALHRAHVETIPFENLDVQLGRRVTRDRQAIFDKLVTRRRGGWCFEMNGLFADMLKEIGFRVRRLAGGVDRASRGDGAIGNHLTLVVDLERPWLVDVGFGNGLIEAVPLSEGSITVGPKVLRLTRPGGGWFRLSDDNAGAHSSYDFHPDLADPLLLDAASARLQTDPASPFVENTTAMRWRDDVHHALRGRVLTVTSRIGVDKRLIGGPSEYVSTLRDVFALEIDGAETLWPKIAARHEAAFGAAGASPKN
jgi:N-hydroxyarylamine O-acetyltransferase